MLEIGEDYVTISDHQGEIVHWVEDEWKEDPYVALAIANAIRIYYECGTIALRKMIS